MLFGYVQVKCVTLKWFDFYLFFQLDADLAPLKDVFQNYSGNSQDPDTVAVNALQREVFAQKYLGFLYLAKSDWYTFFVTVAVLRC